MNENKENLCRKTSLPDKGGTEGGFVDKAIVYFKTLAQTPANT
jgi:hypothetical protein